MGDSTLPFGLSLMALPRLNRWTIMRIGLHAILAPPILYWALSIVLRDEVYAPDSLSTQAVFSRVFPPRYYQNRDDQSYKGRFLSSTRPADVNPPG
jgi:hypothetical protein